MVTDAPNVRIAAWRRDGLPPLDAEALFDRLPPITPRDLLGAWKGEALPTRHPFDDVLGPLGWWGKRFHDVDRVDPLLFERRGVLHAVDPGLLPSALALHPPAFARRPAVRRLVQAILPLLATRSPRARLRSVDRGGLSSAAMIYDDLPVIDHFRSVDAMRVMGLMDYRDMPAPFFFLLTRVHDTSSGSGA